MIFINYNWVVTRWQYTFTHKQYRTTQITTEQDKYTTNVEECGPCLVFASFTLAFALQLRKKHGKTSVRVKKTSVRLRKTSVRVQYTCYQNTHTLQNPHTHTHTHTHTYLITFLSYLLVTAIVYAVCPAWNITSFIAAASKFFLPFAQHLHFSGNTITVSAVLVRRSKRVTPLVYHTYLAPENVIYYLGHGMATDRGKTVQTMARACHNTNVYVPPKSDLLKMFMALWPCFIMF
jgi:hypothetical protein